MIDLDKSQIKKLVCDRARVTLSEVLPLVEHKALETVRFSVDIDEHARAMVLTLDAEMPAVLDERLVINRKWPADWWQALKERWFPGWLLRWFPVEYESIYVNRPFFKAVCPHIHVKGQGAHLQWLLREQES